MTYKYTPVSKGDTYELIKKAQDGDENAKALVIEQNTGLVKKIALKFTSSEYEFDDLVQIGYIGLLKAVYKFIPEYNVMFSTYAVPMILGELKRFLRDNGKIKVSRNLKSEIFLLRNLREQLTIKNGTSPKVSQLAESMGVSKEHILEILEADDMLFNVASLDNCSVEEEYDTYFIEASPESSIDSIIIKSEIMSLNKREKQIIIMRYYKDMTQSEIAIKLGISQVQVSRIEKRALNIIRNRMEER